MSSFTQHDLKSVLQKLSVTSSATTECTPTPSLQETVSHNDHEIATLQQTLQELTEKQKHSDKQILELAHECNRYKSATKKLASALIEKQKIEQQNAQAHQENEHTAQRVDDQTENLRSKIEEQKMQLLRAFTEKKELEAQISSLSCERATLLARLCEIQQKSKQKDVIDDRCAKLEEALTTATQTIQTLEDAHQKNQKAYKEELSVSQACLIEKQRVCEEMQNQHLLLQKEHDRLYNESKEHKASTESMQQHLARRIKECSLLKKSLDEERQKNLEMNKLNTSQQERVKQLECDIESLKNTENKILEEISLKTKMYENTIQGLERHLDDTTHQLQEHRQQLQHANQLKCRLDALETLYSQFGQIVNPNVTQGEQKFSFLTKDIPKASTLFEP